MFQCACGLQPPIFPFREKEAFFHATQTFILCFIQTSSYARTLPLKALNHCFISATFSSHCVLGWSEGLAVHPTPSSSSRIKTTGTYIHWPLSHQKDSYSCISKAESDSVREHLSKIPRVQGETSSGEHYGSCCSNLSATSSHWGWSSLTCQVSAILCCWGGMLRYLVGTGRGMGQSRGHGIWPMAPAPID